METNRTVEDFVEDMISNGRTEPEIKAVATNTRWCGFPNEIKECIKKFEKIIKRS